MQQGMHLQEWHNGQQLKDIFNMRITAIMTAYNETTFLPIKLDWCRRHGLDLYVIDNYSDDGTWEWLQENNVASHRFDTQGAFHLEWLQAEIVRTLHILQPDWVIYDDADQFYQTDEGIRATIEQADEQGCNLIEMEFINILNTGDGEHNYFNSPGKITKIHKYSSDILYTADNVSFEGDNRKCFVDGVIINMGQIKTAEERNQTFERRKKAWELGLCRGWGTHYEGGNAINWLWDKADLEDIRLSKYYKFYAELI